MIASQYQAAEQNRTLLNAYTHSLDLTKDDKGNDIPPPSHINWPVFGARGNNPQENALVEAWKVRHGVERIPGLLPTLQKSGQFNFNPETRQWDLPMPPPRWLKPTGGNAAVTPVTNTGTAVTPAGPGGMAPRAIQAPSVGGAPTQTGTQLDEKTAQDFLQQAGGDKEKAREMARQLGFTF